MIVIYVWLGVKGISAIMKKVNSKTLSEEYFTEMSKLLKDKFNEKFIKMSEAYQQQPEG